MPDDDDQRKKQLYIPTQLFDRCSYRSAQKGDVKRHMRVHRDVVVEAPVDQDTLHCYVCGFKVKTNFYYCWVWL